MGPPHDSCGLGDRLASRSYRHRRHLDGVVHLSSQQIPLHYSHVMPTHASSLSQIEKLKAEIAALQNQALAELTQRRKGIEEELQEIDQQLVQLNGGPKERKPKFPTPAQLVSLAELKPMLAGAPGKTISTRRENLDLRNIRLLTDQNPGLLKMGGSGAWPTVTMLK